MTVAPPRAAAVARLRAVPWSALAALAPALEPALAEVLAGAPAERVLDRLLRAHRGLAAPGREAAAEAVFGVGLWRRRLVLHAGPGARPLALLAALARDLGGAADAEAILGLAPGTLPPGPPPEAALASRADRWSLPDWLDAILAREAGPDADALAEALAAPAPVVLRANRLRTTRDALRARLAAEGVATRAGRFAPDALVVEGRRPNVYGLASWRAGLLEVQDEASQVVGALACTRPGASILDLCAGAGGKTLQLAAATGPAGEVHAADPDATALGRLRLRAARAGAANVTVHGVAPPESLVVDAVLVDAPCSALGPLRRGPDLRWRIDPRGFAALERLQRALLDRAADHVRPGGRLVYATCTFRREENEAVALGFERGHAEFRRVPPEVDPALATPDGFVRTWPHGGGLDGFFAAVYERTPRGNARHRTEAESTRRR